MNETERNQLRSYIIQLRRISAHREQGAEAEIRLEYQKVLNKLQAIVSKYYAIYGNIDDSTMTRADLESASAYNNFLQDVVNNLDGINKPVENQIRQTIEDTYTTCYNGMVNAVKKSTGNSDLGILLSGLSATTPETVKNIIENPMDNLTLSTVLNRKRSQVVSDIKKNLSVGLANGDSYAKMAQRISKSLDSDYKKAMRIVRTESNRAINKGFQDVSDEASDMLLGSDYVEVKEWCSMEDESVRDTHNHLNGKKIHVQDEFESKGRKAKCPCGFGIPEEDINCRCFLAYEFMSREEFLKQGGVIPDEILRKEAELGLADELQNNEILESDLANKIKDTLKYHSNYIPKILEEFEIGIDRLNDRGLKKIFKIGYEGISIKKPSFNEKKRSFYHHGKDEEWICLGISADGSTVAHELFHRIDNMYKFTRNGALFYETRNDFERLKNMAKNSGQTVQSMLQCIYPNAFRKNGMLKEEYRAVSDVISGMSAGKIFLGFKHSKEYWELDEFRLPKETFAQYGRALFDNNNDVLNMMSEIFPKTNKAVFEIINTIKRFG